MRKEYIIAAAAMAAGAYVFYRSRSESGTAGDAEANIFEDGVDAMAGAINEWPIGSEPYRKTIENAAALSGVPVLLLAWLLWKESRYNAAIISGEKKIAGWRHGHSAIYASDSKTGIRQRSGGA